MSLMVDFPGHGVFWLITDDTTIGATTEGALAPLNHCDEDGEVEDIFGTSYAYLFADGTIKRYQTIVGSRDDLRVITDDQS
jgi:hypothetical protein